MARRVLMFGWEFPPHNSGGLGTACEGLSQALALLGTEIIFVLPRRMTVVAEWLRFRFGELTTVERRGGSSALSAYSSPGAFAALYGHSLLDEVRNYALTAAIIARGEQFDLIHAHDWLCFPAGLAAKAVSGKPLVVHVHATEFDRGGGNGVNQGVYEIERAGMLGADAIIAVSDWTKQIIVKHYGIAPEKISVVHNGVTPPRRDAPLAPALAALKRGGEKIVLFVGRLTLQKGPDYFVHLAKRVLELEPNTYFVVVGSGDMEGQIIRLATGLGVGRRFFFPGFLRGEELERVYAAADIYVLPSVSEPFGITPLESLVAGTPVLVSKQSGVAEVLTHALKADFWDIDEMANQIVSVLRHPSLHRTLQARGGDEVKTVSWSAAAAKVAKVYQEQLLC